VFVTQFLLAEAEERAKGWIYEERLAFHVLDRNPDGARVENIMEKLNVRDRFGWCGVLHSASSSAEILIGQCIAPMIFNANGIARAFLKKYSPQRLAAKQMDLPLTA
jgi:hypothetical protein